MSEINMNHFSIKLDPNPSEASVSLDGKTLNVDSIIVRAGVDGYPNVVCSFPAKSAIEGLAAFLPVVSSYDTEKFEGIFREALECVPDEAELLKDPHLQGLFVKSLLEIMLSEVTGNGG